MRQGLVGRGRRTRRARVGSYRPSYSAACKGGTPSSASAAHEKVHVEAILENGGIRRACGQRYAVTPIV